LGTGSQRGASLRASSFQCLSLTSPVKKIRILAAENENRLIDDRFGSTTGRMGKVWTRLPAVAGERNLLKSDGF
jgi:hypothetical protein